MLGSGARLLGTKRNLSSAYLLLTSVCVLASLLAECKTSYGESLVHEVAALLKHWEWHPSALPVLRGWARCDSGSPHAAAELLEGIIAGETWGVGCFVHVHRAMQRMNCLL